MNHTAKRTRRTNYHARKPSSQSKEDGTALLFRNILKSTAITIGVGIGLIIVMSLIAYFSADPDTLVLPLAISASALTALIGGWIAIRIHRHSALICGLLNGGIVTCLMLLVSLFFKSNASGYSAPISALLHASFLLLSCAGAYLGFPRHKVTHHKKK